MINNKSVFISEISEISIINSCAQITRLPADRQGFSQIRL